MPVRTRFPSALVAVVAFAAPAVAQSTYTWQSSGNTTWFDPGNWAGGPAGTTPGLAAAALPTNGTATDIARYTSFLQGSSNGVAIDFGLAAGTLALGAIQLDAQFGVMFGNSSTTTPGVLRLNGATVGGIPNVILGTTSNNVSDSYYMFQNNPQGSGGPGMTLQLGTANGVVQTLQNFLVVDVPITEAAPGSGLTIQKSFGARFRGTNTFSGPLRLVGSSLNVNRDANLGAAPAAPTPNHLVLQPDPVYGPATLDTNAASFTINANRGIAIGPTSGAGDAVFQVQDVEVEGFLSTVIYNGVIANNGAGSGRLVKQGGGTLVLGGANTFTGGTLLQGGDLRLTNLAGLGTTGTVTVTAFGTTDVGFPIPSSVTVTVPGTFARPVVIDYTGSTVRPVTLGTSDFSTGGETIFSGAITANRPLTVRGGNANGTQFSGVISGAGSVTVTGTTAARPVLFTGANTYTGGTTVASGTLFVFAQTGTQSGTGTGPVTVADAATLSGTGRVGGTVTVSSGGTLSPGALMVGTLTAGGTVTVGGGGRFAAELGTNAGGASDRVVVQGGNAFALGAAGSNARLVLSPNGFSGTAGGPAAYTLATAGTVLVNGATASGTFSTFTVGAGGTGGVDYDLSAVSGSLSPGDTFALSATGGNLVLTYTPVPEPTAVLLMAAVGLGVARRLRRVRNPDRAAL